MRGKIEGGYRKGGRGREGGERGRREGRYVERDEGKYRGRIQANKGGEERREGGSDGGTGEGSRGREGRREIDIQGPDMTAEWNNITNTSEPVTGSGVWCGRVLVLRHI